jgi:8-oxo-dGTP pyrophosphatase MutT (NUDIX family)
VASGRRVLPELEKQIEQAWEATLARPGVRLYDGPIFRFEDARVQHRQLIVNLSKTSYRVFVGTNFCNPQLAETYGPDVMANSMGVSTGLLTADGYWMMGRRNQSVAYYPGRVHPFAGSVEISDDVDLFANARRELHEELRLDFDDINVSHLVGLIEDTALRHPEAIFLASTPLTRRAVAAGLDPDEHDGIWHVRSMPDAVEAALQQADLTPVARAALLLGGRHLYGRDWFDGLRNFYFG